MSCGVGVIEPKQQKELLFFGSCIGVIMFSLHALWNVDNLFSVKQLRYIGIMLSVGTLLGFISSMSVWYIYWDNEQIRIPSEFNIQWQLFNFLIFGCILYGTNYFIKK